LWRRNHELIDKAPTADVYAGISRQLRPQQQRHVFTIEADAEQGRFGLPTY
jgi:hypothetical protein